MPYAIELFLDEHADQRIRQIWAALDEGGIPSLGSIPGTRYHPHVSLSVFEHAEPVEVAQVLRPLLATSAGMPLSLEPLGFFLTDEAPVFLGVVPSSRLLTLHRTVHQTIEPLVDRIWPYYRPDALLPHCTLATGVTDKAKALDIVARFPLPVPALASGAHLVENPGRPHHHSASSRLAVPACGPTTARRRPALPVCLVVPQIPLCHSRSALN